LLFEPGPDRLRRNLDRLARLQEGRTTDPVQDAQGPTLDLQALLAVDRRDTVRAVPPLDLVLPRLPDPGRVEDEPVDQDPMHRVDLVDELERRLVSLFDHPGDPALEQLVR